MRNGIQKRNSRYVERNKHGIVENIEILQNHDFSTFGDENIHESLREVGMRQ